MPRDGSSCISLEVIVMVEITVKGTETGGQLFTKQVDTADRIVVISGNQLSRVSLAPLARCSQLQHLHVVQSMITRLDLSPLAECKKLERLVLSQNKLASVNLSPLANCPHLDSLDLRVNPLARVDLSPLVHNSAFSSLLVDDGVQLSVQEELVPEKLPLAFEKIKNRLTVRQDPLKGLKTLSRELLESAVSATLKEFFKNRSPSVLDKERLQLLRNITRRTLFMEIDDLVPILTFDDRAGLMTWLYGLPDSWSFTVEGQVIRFGSTINDDIDQLLQQYDEWEKGGKLE
ncbi:MAG: hypothetical protein ACFFD4_33810 [Candidatus Odinarchaeota archaeon]